jgi:hypothetical protein
MNPKVSTLTAVMVMAGALAVSALAAGCGGTGGMRTGAAGSTGTGAAGATGAAGTGMVTLNSCPNGGVLDCTTAGVNTLANGNVTAFTPEEWNMTAGKWCNTSGLRGSHFSFPPTVVVDGSTVSNTSGVDITTTRFLRLSLTVTPGGYAGGGISFDSCVNASAFSALQFSASIATPGSMAGCEWQVQLQTQDQRPTSQTNPTGGTCDPDAGASCYRFPAATMLTIPDVTPVTITAPFTSFNNPSGSTIMTPTQIVGIQWQVNSGAPPDGGSQAGCAVELHIDDIKFIP